MSARARTEPRPPTLEALRGRVRERLSAGRVAHVEGVARTAARIAAAWAGPGDLPAAAERAAWYHDALKEDGPAEWRAAIARAGETPDPWAARHATGLLHAQAAAAWARTLGEDDPELLAAVRHHPTGHPDWGALGRILYVSDFCEPGRDHAASAGCGALVARATEGPRGLEEASRRILALRLGRMLESGRPIHPDGWRTWNAWAGAGP